MTLPRVQSFEFNEAPWAPRFVRDSITGSLDRALRWGGFLQGLEAPLRAFLAESGVGEVLDLGSGAGGPAPILAGILAKSGPCPRFLLSDLFPHPEAWAPLAAAHPERVGFVAEPVDATAIPPELGRGRARTIFNAFHHLPPELARAVLADAARAGDAIFVAEPFDRNPLRFASWLPWGTPSMLAEPVLGHHDQLAKALITWVFPAIFLVGLWDGVVSTLRQYTEAELRAMVAPLGDGHRWTYGRWSYAPFGSGWYFQGVPVRGDRPGGIG